MKKTVFMAKNISELIYQMNTNKDLQIVGGCTYIDKLPPKSISTFGIKELSQITLHERYIDVGPATSLNDLLALGQNHLPAILYEALNCIASPIIRNMATIGGNICSKGQKLTLYAPLMALDAKIEMRSQNETKIESVINFNGTIPDGFVITNIRIPLPDADISVFRRIGPEHNISQYSASYAFIASTENNSLIGIRLAFAGSFTFRSKELENSLLGHKLPLSTKEVANIQEMVKAEFLKAATDQMISEVVQQQFFNLARYSFEQLT